MNTQIFWDKIGTWFAMLLMIVVIFLICMAMFGCCTAWSAKNRGGVSMNEWGGDSWYDRIPRSASPVSAGNFIAG